jgi:acetyl-CoA/propionyl-CoA carboxylase carboxyl transferase subunit
VHVITDTDREALTTAADLVGLLMDKRAVSATENRPLRGLLPESSRRAYDVHPLVNGLLDEPGLELHARWAPNVVTTLGRLGGGTVGVLANNPLRLGGCLDSASAEKAARFVRTCDAFGIPLVVLVDVPGYLPGVAQEWDGVVRRGAKLLHAFAEATVPRVTVVTRKAYGGAYIAMNSRSLDATRVFAWPGAEVAVMGSVAAIRVLKRREIAGVPEQQRPALEASLAAAHDIESGGVERAVSLGLVDEIIDPDTTRRAVSEALAAAPAGGGHHGNIPL